VIRLRLLETEKGGTYMMTLMLYAVYLHVNRFVADPDVPQAGAWQP
jgi:hypothetical protein